MQTSYSQEAQISPDVPVCLDGGSTIAHQLMLVESAADHDNINPRIFCQGQRNWWTVRDNSGTKITRQMLRHLQGRSATIENYHLVLANKSDGGQRNSCFGSRWLLLPLCETGGYRRAMQRPTMDTP